MHPKVTEHAEFLDVESDRIQALVDHLDLDDPSEIDTGYRNEVFTVGPQEYFVLTDQEADDVWDEQLDAYLDDCVLPELDDNLQNYFDTEAWKEDARMDGRGHSIASYDGDEHEVGDYLIYRMN